jgi:hypothetical protein
LNFGIGALCTWVKYELNVGKDVAAEFVVGIATGGVGDCAGVLVVTLFGLLIDEGCGNTNKGVFDCDTMGFSDWSAVACCGAMVSDGYNIRAKKAPMITTNKNMNFSEFFNIIFWYFDLAFGYSPGRTP